MSNWISVDEKLPKRGEYIGYLEKEPEPGENISCKVVVAINFTGEYWVKLTTHGFKYRWENIGRVTHWMELPEPPKES